ncbi:hypothetical protein, conserved [Leishmania tarentolae]|uniref:Uncharacterized protein n=1 Tax=Leishmania tarentolae TaxID=5689 RepID=A0A640KJR8_LEITA|nr:hypothetical protein, conserved [Leishmania tarentolae]
MPFTSTPPGTETVYVNDVKAQMASILGFGTAATGPSASSLPATESCGLACCPKLRQEGGSCMGQRDSPRHGNGSGNYASVTPPPGAVQHPVRARRGTPLATPTRGGSRSGSRERADSARRRSGVAPLLSRELNMPRSASTSPGTPQLGTFTVFATSTPKKRTHRPFSPATSANHHKEKSSPARRVTMSASRRCGPKRNGAQRAGSPSAAQTDGTLSTGSGGRYAIYANQHPLYSGRGASQRKRTSPLPAAGKATGLQEGLAISVEANTVRQLQRIGAGKPAASVGAAKPAPLKADTASGLCTTVSAGQVKRPTKRASIIEQLAAAATQMKGEKDSMLGQAPQKPYANACLERSSPQNLPRPHAEREQPSSRSAGDSDAKPLGPLPLHDVMRMHLQQTSFNVNANAPGEINRRLPNDTLVLPDLERMPDGDENPMYTQLKAFQFAPASTVAAQPPAPPAAQGSTATVAAGLASSPAPACGIPAPAPPPPPPPPAATALTGTANAPTASDSVERTAASSATAASGAPWPAQPVPARKWTKEEMTEAEEERLLRDLITASHLGQRNTRPLSSGASAVPTTDADLTAAIEMALQLRLEVDSDVLHDWRRPPKNVLLPDPTQPPPTWAVLKSAPAQEAQQAAAVAAIACTTRGASGGHTASPVDGITAAAHDVAGNSAADDEASRVPDCVDYHAPFQHVLRPEYVEHDLVPAALSVGAVTHTDAHDPMKSRSINRTTTGAAAAVAARSDTTVKTLAAQAVILRDPLSLLACEHLAADTIDIAARRRAYLAAMDALHGITHGSALPTNRPCALASSLQDASPLGAVFCELSYPAKVLLSAILYMRALGALPSLLRVGPLTEYSPVVDKENCIELVFYNPSDEEQEVQEAREALQESRYRRHWQRSFVKERVVGSAVFYNQVPACRRSLMEAVTSSNVRERAHSQSHTERQPKRSPGAPFRSRSGRQSGNTTRRLTGDSLDGEGEAHAGHAHNGADLTPSPVQKRRPTAIEERLMSTLSAAAMRRSGSAASRSVSSAAANSRTVSPHPFSSRAISTSLAGEHLNYDEASLVAGDALDGLRRGPSARGRELCPSESDGSWLLRNTSQDEPAPHPFSHQIGDKGAVEDESLRWNDKGGAGGQRYLQRSRDVQRRSQLPAKLQRYDSDCTSAFASRVPHVRITPPSGTSTGRASGAATQTAAATAANSPALRRSSVTVALEDLQQTAERIGLSPAEHAASARSSPPNSLPGSTNPFSTVMQSAKAVPLPPAHFEMGPSTATRGSKAAAASANQPAPASAHGPGAARFPKGEQELCVVLRAVVAQKSHVYSFGKAETVHVLPPLPQSSADDDKTLLHKQRMQKAEMDRLAMDSSNPLHKFLYGGDKHRGEARAEADQWRATLLDSARRAATAARRRIRVTLNGSSLPTSTDYGDLVVAFILSGNASELSGSVPDMMELEALRYRIFSLLGYSASDPAGMQAKKEVAGVGEASAAAQSPAPAAMRFSTGAPSFLDPDMSRLQQHLSSFKAFHTPAPSQLKVKETPLSVSSTSPCVSKVKGQRCLSFFEDALQRVDPRADLDDGEGRRGHYRTEFDAQQRQKTRQQRQKQDVQALMLQRYPVYRASSVAESTLQTFFAEAKEAVAAARQRGRQRHSPMSSRGGPSANEGRFSSPDPSLDPLTRHTRGDAATTALQDAERDLLRFRPMSLNSFHRELTDAVQYALDLQIRQGKKNALQAFHM